MWNIMLFTVLCSFALSCGHDTGATKEGEIKKGSPVHQYLAKLRIIAP
jgi:hypothetical protein